MDNDITLEAFLDFFDNDFDIFIDNFIEEEEDYDSNTLIGFDETFI